jgi:hypothetical protein
MATNNSILVTNVRSNKSENMVWAVYAQGNEQAKAYCTSPYKAMKYAFLLKKQTGFYINDICLTQLSLEIKRLKELKEAAALTPEQKEGKERIDAAVEQFVEEHSVNNVLAKADEEKAKTKGKGKRKASKKQEKVAA